MVTTGLHLTELHPHGIEPYRIAPMELHPQNCTHGIAHTGLHPWECTRTGYIFNKGLNSATFFSFNLVLCFSLATMSRQCWAVKHFSLTK